MNPWIRKSIEIANAPRYLDKLHEVYPMQINPERPLPKAVVPKIKSAFEKRNDPALIKLLIDNAAVFPVKDSYIGFLRAKKNAIKENPKTVYRIAQRLYSLGFERMMQEASRPKETNRQLGSAFKRWTYKLGYKLMTDEQKFLATSNQTLILKASDKLLAKIARERLGCKLKKGIDILIKKKKIYVIGEAKFLTTSGGEQDRGFDDASSFVQEKTGNALRIAILDGCIWLKNIGLLDKIKQSDDNIMSALVLKKFIARL